jgi:hypothetical protein
LRYICREVQAAIQQGVPVQGICLYPILNHPGWDDDRHCHNGLWDYADPSGHRDAYAPLAEELKQQQVLFEGVSDLFSFRDPLPDRGPDFEEKPEIMKTGEAEDLAHAMFASKPPLQYSKPRLHS